MSIGEFAGRSRLSPKALRLYDELGLLVPARVDESSGYRSYSTDQLERARLISALRELQIPLAQIKAIVGLEPADAARRIVEYWARAETEHAARRRLAASLVDRLSGKRSIMFDVNTRTIPARHILCLRRNVAGEAAAWALGKEFIAVLQRHDPPRIDGREGAAYCIYWSEVSEDSDGPIEWCRPVPDEQAETLAATIPELSLRTEAEHEEAFVHLGPGGETTPAEWQLVSESVRAWAAEHAVQASDLGVRVTFLASRPITDTSRPDCDFAVPIAPTAT
ncbi:MAG: helix-turn-helix domain-containing protein [Solirubrobacteraceae bacterium]